jgi:hypothetical protein
VVRLDYPNPDGSTTREHLIALQSQTGQHEPELEAPGGLVSWLLDLFWDAAAGRSAFYDPQPLSWTEMKSWSELRDHPLCPFEIDVIRAADRTFRAECAAIVSERRPVRTDE